MIGLGSHGTVSQDPDDPGSVIKCMELFGTATEVSNAYEYLRAEAIAEPIALIRARACCVPNIVKFDNIWIESGEVCMRLEKLASIDLAAISDDKARKYIRQLFEAVSGLHKAGIFHCDIKIENLMVTMDEQMDLKVIDFGLARVDCNRLSSNPVHIYTKPYRPPEVMLLQRTIDLAKTDTWAAATTAAEILMKKEYIFGCGGPSIEILSAIMSGVGCPQNYDISWMPFWPKFREMWDSSMWHGPLLVQQIEKVRGALAADFIRCALKVSPIIRSTAEMLLQHPYLSGSCDPTKPPGCNWLSEQPNRELISRIFSRYDCDCAVIGSAMLDYIGANKDDPQKLSTAIEVVSVYRCKYYKYQPGCDTSQEMIVFILSQPRALHFLSLYHVIST